MWFLLAVSRYQSRTSMLHEQHGSGLHAAWHGGIKACLQHVHDAVSIRPTPKQWISIFHTPELLHFCHVAMTHPSRCLVTSMCNSWTQPCISYNHTEHGGYTLRCAYHLHSFPLACNPASLHPANAGANTALVSTVHQESRCHGVSKMQQLLAHKAP